MPSMAGAGGTLAAIRGDGRAWEVGLRPGRMNYRHPHSWVVAIVLLLPIAAALILLAWVLADTGP
jgi:hypothetical protein